ncbi:hypothetical protein JL475_00325 [Streptomyces sp. M2CJ-2]|uniref:hypothetical protein n=1 Tax=Streptomyces sp. M2CJ-2 TaxID=2803948 RepID=UPI00192349C1|nr:hypothetical protein [Streptomyces sp. M2CJ-2]MBL3664491.1 hypothetical protein [Streptomyces sp. M2CJ-2]
MLKTIRRRSTRSLPAADLAAANGQWLHGRLDNIVRLVAEIRALPEGASAQELTARLVAEAEDADTRAFFVDELTEQASRTAKAA